MHVLLLSLATLFTALPGHSIPPDKLEASGTVEIAVTGARSNAGRVVALLFATSDGFPADVGKAAFTASAPIQGGRATIQVQNVRAGSYSIVVFHDADGDGRMKRNVLGIPREGVGVSRYERGRPSFERTLVEVPSTGARFTIGLNYR